MICHELSLVFLIHMRPSQARRLDNIRFLCHRPESSSRLPAPATCTALEIYQHKSLETDSLGTGNKKYACVLPTWGSAGHMSTNDLLPGTLSAKRIRLLTGGGSTTAVSLVVSSQMDIPSRVSDSESTCFLMSSVGLPDLTETDGQSISGETLNELPTAETTSTTGHRQVDF